MLTKEQIIDHLKDYNLVAVAKGTGLSYISVHRFVQDPDRACRGTTVRLLSDWLLEKAEAVLNDDCGI